MTCPDCLHPIPPAPPLQQDYPTNLQAYKHDWTQWNLKRKSPGWCRCPRCNLCWGRFRQPECKCKVSFPALVP